jgi:hypothetical protein
VLAGIAVLIVTTLRDLPPLGQPDPGQTPDQASQADDGQR